MGRTGGWISWLVLLFTLLASTLSGISLYVELHAPSNAELESKIKGLESQNDGFREQIKYLRGRQDQNDKLRQGLNDLYIELKKEGKL